MPLVDQRPATRLLRGLDFIGGVDLVGAGGPVPIGPPTHRDMLSLATPRAVSEAVSADALGVATASAFALVPYAVKTIAGWLRGAGGDAAPDHPILTESEETRALAGVRADRHVLDAGVRQRGRTVALSLVVPADTPPATARTIAERFVLLVKTFASAEPDPDGEVGAGDFDYVVRVSSPTEAVIALGGKATSDTTINW